MTQAGLELEVKLLLQLPLESPTSATDRKHHSWLGLAVEQAVRCYARVT